MRSATVAVELALFVAVLAILGALAVLVTVEEDGSGSLGPASGPHVSYCLPTALCTE